MGKPNRFKKFQSSYLTGFTAIFSMVGVFFLGAIIVFLLMYGADSLT
jgi:hypothetical protein